MPKSVTVKLGTSRVKLRKGKKLKSGLSVRRSKCKTCVFRREEEGGCPLAPGRREEIHAYVLTGVNQLCHHEDNKKICRGGRELQLQIWHRLGFIEAPTDAALRKAMIDNGFSPGSHICNEETT